MSIITTAEVEGMSGPELSIFGDPVPQITPEAKGKEEETFFSPPQSPVVKASTSSSTDVPRENVEQGARVLRLAAFGMGIAAGYLLFRGARDVLRGVAQWWSGPTYVPPTPPNSPF